MTIHTSHCFATIDDQESGGDALDERSGLGVLQTICSYMLKKKLIPDLAEDEAKADSGDKVKGADWNAKPSERCYRV
jgi:hypothetical protein